MVRSNLKPLKEQGLCNKIYTKKLNDITVIVKEFINKETDHLNEYKIQKRVSLQKISPKTYEYDKKFMISQYIEGVHKKVVSKKDLLKIALTLKKLHKTALRQNRVDLKKLLPRDKYPLLQKVKRFKSDLALTHNDLNPKNLIFTKDHLYLIDFEYAGVNDIYFDLASICVEFDLDSQKERYFLRQYFKDKIVNYDKLKLFKKIYRLSLHYWFTKNMLKSQNSHKKTRTNI